MEFIIAPLIISILTGILAAIISITDKIVNNYGEITISINNGKKEIKIDGGENLLTTLSSQEIYLPSACGGRGSCGACKCKVTSDVGEYLPTEIPYLTKEEMKENIRLGCQIKLKKDISIEIPESLFNVKKYEATVEKIVDVTHDIKEVLFNLGDEEVNFTAGMYMQLCVPPYDKIKSETQRAYSISSKPSDKNHIELLIRLVPGGIATTWVHTYLKEGDKVKLIGPFGEFQATPTNSTMICVAGGSGMAPFKSMLYHMYENNVNDREIWYFFGARTKKDLFYLEELAELQKKWPNFHFIPALSEPEGEDWEGETGLITDVLDKYLKTIIEPGYKEGYLCGSPGMINACNNVMTANGIKLENIYYDKFA
ncbi:MAG: Na+-transporting NADH:ubiquinone oxidoreductase subunit [Fusobacteriaceae bacterium]|jgi:Na+-transporting NADH:ubiquinone oxidoreductase subunit F|nr:oxidoreductase FAD/NAD(P)-binding domain protein [Fusobacteriales bacterium]MDN5303342.1 Na+-transporting NADH:ubiquinone oxidoreductase subunit [Fusobacteriaceae bacterium]